jgi:hypothetical protein
MNSAEVSLPEPAERYLRDLDRALVLLPREEREEIVSEIRSHLEDRVAQGAADVLAGFQGASEYAAAFLQEGALRGALARGSSWSIGRALVSGARSLSWWYVVIVLGLLHVYGIAFLVLAALKPIFPGHVGLFVGNHHLTLGALGGDDLEQAREVLGWWAVPVFVVVGTATLWGANWILRVLGRWRLGRLRSARAR